METNKLKIMLIDNVASTRENTKQMINKSNDAVVKSDFDDAISALEYLKSNEIDVVVTDLVLPKLDGFSFLDELSQMNLNHSPKVIVTSAISSDELIERALKLGASYYMIKPIDDSVLLKRIKQISNFTATTQVTEPRKIKNKALEEKITNIFITVGIPAHIKGYQFLREAIKMAIDNPEIINSITKKLYPSIAERFDTSASKVERAIRHAIEVAWNRGKIENINTLFGIRVYSNNEKPTNGEFIALVADKMLIEGA
ncbi:MAG: sporulation transcription factor Spo0A [Clostridia bacterium]|nr:sporulation transcription factor Spo0A [Clostridia bacterium]